MEIKYQVFVSSTYQDLVKERQEIMQALLELDCIPVGMELFPAADDDQWTLIKGLIDDCDYYILIVGGRYGSVNEKGISYTQMEYEYAISKEIPIISFLHKEPDTIPVGKSEKEQEGKRKLEDFKALVQQKMCRYWIDPVDLGSQVSRSLVKLIKSKPRSGWIKADLLPSENTTQELLELRETVQSLKNELIFSNTEAPKGSESLKQGEDIFTLTYDYEEYSRNTSWNWLRQSGTIDLSWNNLFFLISPLMVDEANETDLKNSIDSYIYENIKDTKLKGLERNHIRKPEITNNDFQTIKIQLRALGLIKKNEKKRSIKVTDTYWTLSSYGDSIMVQLRALKK